MIIPNILTKEQQQEGFYLSEEEDTVFLMKRGEEKPLAAFSSYGTTIAVLRHEAQQYVEQVKSGVSFGKVV